MFSFGEDRPRRRLGLTPMIDVVFLLLVFFMLASRFGTDQQMPLHSAQGGAAYAGPPRLVTVTPGGVLLNGAPVALTALPGALRGLMTRPDQTVVLRPRAGADMQRLVTVVQALRDAGLTHLALVE